MKKLISLALALAMVFALSIPAIAAHDSTPSTQIMVSLLREKGFSDDFLDRRTDIQLRELYERCKNNEVVFGGSEISYLKINSNGGVSPTGIIPDYDMILEISPLYDVGSDRYGNNTYEKCWVYVYYEWTPGRPTIAKKDAIAINWDSNIWSYSSFTHTDYSDRKTPYYTYTSPAETNQGGIGYFAHLDPEGSHLIGDTTITLLPAKTPLYPASSGESHFTSAINANYVHDRNLLPLGLSFSYKGMGISINYTSGTDSTSDSYVGYYKWKP